MVAKGIKHFYAIFYTAVNRWKFAQFLHYV